MLQGIKTSIIALGIGSLLFLGCSPRSLPPTEQNLRKVVAQITDDTITPTINAFATALYQLDSRANLFCKSPSQFQLTALQKDWRQVSDLWARTSLYLFGPLNADKVFPEYTFFDSLRLRGTDYLPVVKADINKDLA